MTETSAAALTDADVPSATSLAATWDPARVAAIGELLAREARRKGVDVLLAPTVNLHRTPYGGRHFECFSEDPLLTSRIGAAYVRGLQRCGIAATVKHFVGNDSETQRMTVDVRIDDRTLRELYLAPFEEILRQANPWAVMAGYNRVNDVTLTLPDEADDVEALMTPPQQTAPVRLAAAQSVSVVVEHDVDESRFSAIGTSVQITLEPPHGTDDEEIAAAAALAAASDVAVVVVGTTAEVESEGFDRTSLALPGRQDELVRRVIAANPRTVVVVNSGAPVLLPWAQDAAAVLLTWFSGQEFGHALADVLLGKAEPGGRLPTTWPASEAGLPSTQPEDGVLTYREGLFIGYRAVDRDGRIPLFPFGHGTGYTTWSYDSLTVDHDAAGAVAACVQLRNTGARRGREVVQVYASRPGSAVSRPVKWLVGFAAVDADPGETIEVGILIPPRLFQHWDGTAWATEPGPFTLRAGPSSASLPLTVQTQPDPAGHP